MDRQSGAERRITAARCVKIHVFGEYDTEGRIYPFGGRHKSNNKEMFREGYVKTALRPPRWRLYLSVNPSDFP